MSDQSLEVKPEENKKKNLSKNKNFLKKTYTSGVIPNPHPNLCKELDLLVMGGLVSFPTGSHGLCKWLSQYFSFYILAINNNSISAADAPRWAINS